MGGFAVQVRAIAVNITYLAVTRATIEMDPSGTSAAAHTISVQLWQLGTIILYSLSSLATIFVPRALNKKDAEGVGVESVLVTHTVPLWSHIMHAFASP